LLFIRRVTLRYTTDDESALNIPLGAVMKLLIGDSMHQGLLDGKRREAKVIVNVHRSSLNS
jgi:hypothetical protein